MSEFLLNNLTDLKYSELTKYQKISLNFMINTYILSLTLVFISIIKNIL